MTNCHEFQKTIYMKAQTRLFYINATILTYMYMYKPLQKPKITWLAYWTHKHSECLLEEMNVHKKYLISFFKQNVRLLSQFVSNHTGMIYHRGITGLCIPMQKHIASLIKTSRAFGKNSHSFSMSLLLEKVFICVFLLI